MIRKFLLPVLAVAGLCFAIFMVMRGNQPLPAALPVAPPAQPPFETFVAGAGLIEAASENIAIGAPTPGLVTRVHVKIGDKVKAGDPLFTLDDRSLKAQAAAQRQALEVARQQLARLEAMPRAEELPPLEARVAQQLAALDDARQQLARLESVTDARAVSQDDLTRARFAVQAAQAQHQQAQAELALARAGAWKADVAVARAQIESAQAQLDQTLTELDRLTVRAPIAGTLLQVKLRVGEFAVAGNLPTPLMVLGDTSVLHVRVDVDENDAWRVQRGSPAVGFARGNRNITTPMTFVHFEPYVVPKKSLTGESTERVDTRVLQIIYAFDPANLPLYVGQQMDVFIQSPPSSSAAPNAPAASAPAPAR